MEKTTTTITKEYSGDGKLIKQIETTVTIKEASPVVYHTPWNELDVPYWRQQSTIANIMEIMRG